MGKLYRPRNTEYSYGGAMVNGLVAQSCQYASDSVSAACKTFGAHSRGIGNTPGDRECQGTVSCCIVSIVLL